MRVSVLIAGFLGALASAHTLATTYTIDSSKSFVSFVVPSGWTRGEPSFVLTHEDGTEEVLGYQWTFNYVEERYPIEGTVTLGSIVEPSNDNYTRLYHTYIPSSFAISTPLPAGVVFALPSNLYVDKTSQTLKWDNQCTFRGFFDACSVGWPVTRMTSSMPDDEFTLTGSHSTITETFDPALPFNQLVTPEVVPDFDYASSSYTFHIVSSVPETPPALTLIAGLAVLIRLKNQRG